MFAFLVGIKSQKPITKFVNAVRMINFLRKKCSSSNDLVEMAKMALIKPGRVRKPEDHQTIEKLMGRYKFFQELKHQYLSILIQGMKVFSEFCQYLYFRVAEGDEFIIRKGEFGSTFFVILTGSVRVVIYNPKNSRAKDQMAYQQKMLNHGQNIIPDYENEELFDKMEIVTLQAGSTFGELALLQNNATTSAAIITNRKTEFACMDKKNFWKYSGRFKQEELDKKLNTLRMLPFLNFWHEMELKTISFEFKAKSYYKGDKLFKQGEKNNGLYMITSGEVMISKAAGFDGGEEIFISVVTTPSVIGEDMQETYDHTATCVSLVTTVYYIAKNDLEKRLNWNKKSKEIIEEISKTRKQWRQDREDLLRSQTGNQQLIQNDGEVVHVKELQKMLNLQTIPSPTSNDHKFHKYALKKGCDRISKKEDKITSLNFLEAEVVLDKYDLKEEDFAKKNFLNKRNKTLASLTPMNALERAQKLGLGYQCKSFRETQRKEKKLKEQFQKNLVRLIKEHRSRKSKKMPAIPSSMVQPKEIFIQHPESPAVQKEKKFSISKPPISCGFQTPRSQLERITNNSSQASTFHTKTFRIIVRKTETQNIVAEADFQKNSPLSIKKQHFFTFSSSKGPSLN